MGTFTVPNQINSGDTSDATKAMANWNQVVTDLNSGHLIDATNCNQAFAKDNVEPAFSDWKPVVFGAASFTNPSTTNIQLSSVPIYLDPSRYTAGSRTTQFRIAASVYTNSVAPGTTITAFLGPITTLSSGSSGSPSTFQTNAVTARADFATPAAGTSSHVEGTAVGAFTAGHYALWVVSSGLTPGGCVLLVTATLEMRQT